MNPRQTRRRRARRLSRLVGVSLATLLLSLVSAAFLATPASADDTPDSWRITRYDVDAQVASDGTTRVRLVARLDVAPTSRINQAQEQGFEVLTTATNGAFPAPPPTNLADYQARLARELAAEFPRLLPQ